jgi:hypothetical protein|tara:strand:+ start:7216 stop:7734 length:519 start_codon:yes stop_codon:yes gene_type:complete
MPGRLSLLLLLLLGGSTALRPFGLRPRSMRSRLLRSGDAPTCSEPKTDEEDDRPALLKLLTTNRYTSDARANQLKWAREVMDAEVPEATADGQEIGDKDDFVRKYIASEQEKFGRALEWDEAAKEVDEWLLKQATFAPSKTSATDLGLGVLVFLLAFGGGLFFANGTPTPTP